MEKGEPREREGGEGEEREERGTEQAVRGLPTLRLSIHDNKVVGVAELAPAGLNHGRIPCGLILSMTVKQKWSLCKRRSLILPPRRLVHNVKAWCIRLCANGPLKVDLIPERLAMVKQMCYNPTALVWRKMLT